MVSMEITGNVRKRFIEAAVRLRKLDPVRGEATVHGLDQISYEMITPRERLLKRKFIDSFALICAIKKGGDNTSAACIEEGAPQGTIIRIASNAGVSEQTLRGVRELVAVLNGISDKEQHGSSEVESDILTRILRLDIMKLRGYIQDLRTAKDVFTEPVRTVEARIAASSASTPALQDFLEWFGRIGIITDLPVNLDPESLIEVVKWAQNARAYYFDHLQAAFSTKLQPLPRWVCAIFKLGRYSIAAKALVKFASEFPDLFNPMIVEPVEAPPRTTYEIPMDEVPLTCVLRRVVGDRASEYLPRLARVWNTSDVETDFQRACSVDRVVHAEMQLVNFYDHNPQYKPSFRFIGVSKKSCYLCQMFLAIHPQSLCVSSCHQKLYMPWMPPPVTDSSVYRRYKIITKELTKSMEAAAKVDLERRLGGKRRPAPADSTAGVSLSGLTEAMRTESQNLWRSQTDLQATSSITVEGCGEDNVSETTQSPKSLHTIDVIELTQTDANTELVAKDKGVVPTVTEDWIDDPDPNLFLAMVFHFLQADDFNKQDIVSGRDIFDLSTNRPSWGKLLEILKADNAVGIAFQEGRQMIIMNNRIRVSNERQFLACLQHLLNSNTFNSEALVCNI